MQIAEPIEESTARLTARTSAVRIKNSEHELACELEVQRGDGRLGSVPRLVIACTWVIDSTWVTSQRIPALSRRIAMQCSFHLEPEV